MPNKTERALSALKREIFYKDVLPIDDKTTVLEVAILVTAKLFIEDPTLMERIFSANTYNAGLDYKSTLEILRKIMDENSD